MDRVNDWLARAARRDARRPVIEEALLGGRFVRYALYRLRFFGARTGVAAVLHTARIFLAFRLFGSPDFELILAAEAAASLLSSFWWGFLEPMREDVREAFAAGKPRRAETRVAEMLARSIRLALAAAAAGAAWSVIGVCSGRGFGPSSLFILAVFARLAADLVLRCFHSGVFAVRRVYRPFWSLAGLEALGFGGGLALWPLIGTWALPTAALISAAVASVLSYAFSARAYRHIGIHPRPFARRRESGAGKKRLAGEGLDSGLAFAFMHTDGILLLALLAAGRRGMPAAAAFVLAAAPLVRAGFDWTQLFYFDLKRLERPLLDSLRVPFERQLRLLALPIGAAAWVGALILGLVFFGRLSAVFAACTAAFFITRSLAAALEMRAFARRAYGRLLAAGLIVLAAAAAAGTLVRDGAGFFAAMSAGFFFAAAWLHPRFAGFASLVAPRLKTALAFPDWGLSLRRMKTPVFVGMASFCAGSPHRGMDEPKRWQEEDRWAHIRIAEECARRLGRFGEAALSGPGRLIWFGPPPSGGLMPRWLLAEGMGLVGRVETAGPFDDGPAAAAWLLQSGKLGGRSQPGDPVAAAAAESLPAVFRAMLPEGIVMSPHLPPPPAWRRLPGETRREIWREALAFAAGDRIRPRGGFDVTVSLDGGSIGCVFAAAEAADREIRRRWRGAIRRRNLASLFRESSSGRG